MEISFVFRQDTVGLTALGKVIRQMPGPWAPSMLEQLDYFRTPLRPPLCCGFLKQLRSHPPALEHPPGVGGRSAGALHSCQELFLGFSSVLFFFCRCMCLCPLSSWEHPSFLEQHPAFGNCWVPCGPLKEDDAVGQDVTLPCKMLEGGLGWGPKVWIQVLSLPFPAPPSTQLTEEIQGNTLRKLYTCKVMMITGLHVGTVLARDDMGRRPKTRRFPGRRKGERSPAVLFPLLLLFALNQCLGLNNPILQMRTLKLYKVE